MTDGKWQRRGEAMFHLGCAITLFVFVVLPGLILAFWLFLQAC